MAPLKRLLLLALLLGSFLQYTHEARATNVGIECCSDYYRKAIPLRKLVGWRQTSEECPKMAILLITVRGKTICSDPQDQKTKRAVKYLQHLL